MLARFAAGGPELVLIWFAFMFAALALIPVSVALAVTPQRLQQTPALAATAAIAGAFAGILQAVGLSRWVFAVPVLAAAHAGPAADAATRAAAEQAFTVLNLYGGVAIGEHLGQALTALFVLCLALLQLREAQPRAAALGIVTALALVTGTGEGLAMALGSADNPFALFTIAGFLGLTAWLVGTGAGLLRTGVSEKFGIGIDSH